MVPRVFQEFQSMSVWYAQNRDRSRDSGKFRQRAQTGLRKTAGGKHRGWSYEFVLHMTGSSVRRETCSVAICDPYGNRVDYLRGFTNLERAGSAAREWIDKMLAKMLPPS